MTTTLLLASAAAISLIPLAYMINAAITYSFQQCLAQASSNTITVVTLAAMISSALVSVILVLALILL